jgi:small subunit ribosomal protein S14
MAKKSKIARNEQRRALVAKYATRRAALKSIIVDPTINPVDQLAAVQALAALPRNSAKSRVRNRCALTGRPRGTYRKFGLSRIALRELGLRGELPGVTKASW